MPGGKGDRAVSAPRLRLQRRHHIALAALDGAADRRGHHLVRANAQAVQHGDMHVLHRHRVGPCTSQAAPLPALLTGEVVGGQELSSVTTAGGHPIPCSLLWALRAAFMNVGVLGNRLKATVIPGEDTLASTRVGLVACDTWGQSYNRGEFSTPSTNCP
jgi:hypothetical protein